MWWVAHAIGYLVAVIVGSCFIKCVVDRLHRTLLGKTATSEREYSWMATLVGVVERTLYVAALEIGKGELIGVWLALKAAGQWQVWKEATSEGRATYQVFLIGSGLSVLYAGAGFKIIGWMLGGEWLRPLLAVCFVIAIAIVLQMWIVISGKEKRCS